MKNVTNISAPQHAPVDPENQTKNLKFAESSVRIDITSVVCVHSLNATQVTDRPSFFLAKTKHCIYRGSQGNTDRWCTFSRTPHFESIT